MKDLNHDRSPPPPSTKSKMADKNILGMSALGSVVLFGAGFITAILFRKIFPGTSSGGSVVDTLAKRASTLAAIRKGGYGRNHKMVFVVRTDLGMGKGKIAAQVGHAAVMCYQKASVMDVENLNIWEATGCTKICLKADGDQKSLLEIQRKAKEFNIVAAVVRDAGHTQVDPGTITVLGVGPAPVSEIDKVTGHLKLM